MDLREIQNRKNSSSNRHPWELARLEILKKKLNAISKNLNTNEIVIVDIGCGDTFVLETISEHFRFKNFYGVDTAFQSEDINNIEKKYNGKIKLFNDVNDLKLNEKDVHIVLLMDVIEHIENDKKFVNDLYKKEFINEKSVILATVPSYQNLFCSHDNFLLHFRRYKNSEFINLFEGAGFKITESGYFFFVLIIPRIIKVLAEKVFPNKTDNSINGSALTYWNHNKLITNFFKFVLMTDYRLSAFFLRLKIKIPGLSNFVICKKFA